MNNPQKNILTCQKTIDNFQYLHEKPILTFHLIDIQSHNSFGFVFVIGVLNLQSPFISIIVPSDDCMLISVSMRKVTQFSEQEKMR